MSLDGRVSSSGTRSTAPPDDRPRPAAAPTMHGCPRPAAQGLGSKLLSWLRGLAGCQEYVPASVLHARAFACAARHAVTLAQCWSIRGVVASACGPLTTRGGTAGLAIPTTFDATESHFERVEELAPSTSCRWCGITHHEPSWVSPPCCPLLHCFSVPIKPWCTSASSCYCWAPPGELFTQLTRPGTPSCHSCPCRLKAQTTLHDSQSASSKAWAGLAGLASGFTSTHAGLAALAAGGALWSARKLRQPAIRQASEKGQAGGEGGVECGSTAALDAARPCCLYPLPAAPSKHCHQAAALPARSNRGGAGRGGGGRVQRYRHWMPLGQDAARPAAYIPSLPHRLPKTLGSHPAAATSGCQPLSLPACLHGWLLSRAALRLHSDARRAGPQRHRRTRAAPPRRLRAHLRVLPHRTSLQEWIAQGELLLERRVLQDVHR